MATREYRWVGVNLRDMPNEVGGAETITFDPVTIGGVEADVRVVANYDPSAVPVTEFDVYMKKSGWVPV